MTAEYLHIVGRWGERERERERILHRRPFPGGITQVRAFKDSSLRMILTARVHAAISWQAEAGEEPPHVRFLAYNDTRCPLRCAP